MSLQTRTKNIKKVGGHRRENYPCTFRLTLMVRETSSASTSYSWIQTIPTTNELSVQKLPSSERVSQHDFKKCNRMDNNQS